MNQPSSSLLTKGFSLEFLERYPLETSLLADFPVALRAMYPDAVLDSDHFVIEEHTELGLAVLRNAISIDYLDDVFEEVQGRYILQDEIAEQGRLTHTEAVGMYDETKRALLGIAFEEVRPKTGVLQTTEVHMNRYLSSTNQTTPHIDGNTHGPALFMGRGQGGIEVAHANLSLHEELLSSLSEIEILELMKQDFFEKSENGQTTSVYYGGSDIVVFDGSKLTHNGFNSGDSVRESVVVYRHHLR